MFRNMHLKQKLFILFILLSVVPALITSLLMYYQSKQNMESLFVIIGVILLAASLVSYFLSRALTKPLKSAMVAAKRVAEGDLSVDVSGKMGKSEAGEILTSLGMIAQNLRSLTESISQSGNAMNNLSYKMIVSSDEISSISHKVSNAVQELAEGASDNADSIRSGSHQVKEISEGLKQIAYNMEQSEELAEKAKTMVQTGEKSVEYQEVKMEESKNATLNVNRAVMALSEKSNQIEQILEAISGIAEQTNLLSLNAAIEAARAGEHGKGFAVVAEEVRKLAEKSKASAVKIGELIKDVQYNISQTVDEMDKAEIAVGEQEKALSETVRSFRDIADIVKTMTSNINMVTIASNILSQNANHTENVFKDISGTSDGSAGRTQEVASLSENQAVHTETVSKSSRELSQVAKELLASAGRFKG